MHFDDSASHGSLYSGSRSASPPSPNWCALMGLYMASSRGSEACGKATHYPLSSLDYVWRSSRGRSKQPHCCSLPLSITHLAYADDLLLFARVDESMITLIEERLADFGAQARLLPNLCKLNLYMADTNNRIASRLLEITRF